MYEGQKIQRILRRSTNRVKVRRAQVVLASEQGYKAPAIAEKMVSSISIETLRTILHERKVRLRRTKTWKECNDPRLKAKKN
jgi:hypothetical protein